MTLISVRFYIDMMGDEESYFRGHKFWRTTEGARGRSVPHVLLAETIITNLDMSIKS